MAIDVCLRRFCLLSMSIVWDICLFRVGLGHDGPPGSVSEWCTASGMVSATRPLRHVLTMLVRMRFMFVSILASSMVLGSAAQSVLLYVARIPRLGVACHVVM